MVALFHEEMTGVTENLSALPCRELEVISAWVVPELTSCS
jgi:hypothetical protein